MADRTIPGLLSEEEKLLNQYYAPRARPSTGLRRQGSPIDSANLPVDILRGRLAGLLGLVPDVLNFMGRSPMPTETFGGETQYDPRPQLPFDTEYYLKNLPLAPTSRVGQVAGQAASFVPLNPAPIGRGAMAAAKAAERAAMAAGRAGERYAERVVPQIMERGGLPAEMVAAMGQGTQSKIYLPDLPSKPNPLVGTRYQTVQEPGIVPRREINFDDLLGGSIMTYPTDMLSRNVRVTNVSDVPLGANSFITPGGLPYMMDATNIANKIGYASNKGAATSQNNRALQAIEENLAMGGTGRVFMAPHTMPRGGENFSTGPTLGLLSLIDVTNPSPKLLNELSDRIRGATVKGVKEKYKDFIGLNDPAASIQLLTGEGLLAGSPGDLRKVFVEKAGSVAAEKGMGFNYKDLQNAILDPNVMNKPSFLMGDSIYEALPRLGTRPGTHGAYGFDMPGVFVGNTRGAPISEFMKPLYEQILPTQMNKPGPRAGVYADADQLTRGKLSTAGEGISMFMDEEQIKRLQRLLQGD